MTHSQQSSLQPTSPSRARRWLSRAVDVVLWAAVAGVLLLAILPRDSGPTEGTQAAEHLLPRVGAAGSVRIPGELERPLLIEAFASWCGACRRNSGILTQLEGARRAGQLDVLAVSVDEHESNALDAQRSWPIVVDVVHDRTGQFSRDYRVEVLPTYILIGVDGTVQRVTTGNPGASDIRAWLHAAEQ